jgi:hypothetical protein
MVPRFALTVVLSSLVGCAQPESLPLAHLPRKVAILPAHNRTGDPLAVSGSGLIDRYVTHSGEVTVSDVLGSEARLQLQHNGFEVLAPEVVEKALQGRVPTSPESALDLAAQSGLGTPFLYLEIRRWEPDIRMHVKYVIVGLTASLVDPSTRQVLWQVEHRPAPVPTPGEVMMEGAYVTAARKVMAEMLRGLRPDPPGSR